MKKAELTRQKILKKAFDIIYKKGFQQTSIDEIIAKLELTKGAFYYHFNSKDQMGIAIIKEFLNPDVREQSKKLLSNSKKPLEAIFNLIKGLLFDNPFLEVTYGCPTGNLIQEVSPWKDDFRIALKENVDQWSDAIEDCIEQGKKNEIVRSEINSKHTAYFIMSSYWGIRNFGKLQNDDESYEPYLNELKLYLFNLK